MNLKTIGFCLCTPSNNKMFIPRKIPYLLKIFHILKKTSSITIAYQKKKSILFIEVEQSTKVFCVPIILPSKNHEKEN